MKISPNTLHMLEAAFLEKMGSGAIPVELGVATPHAAFVSMIADPASRQTLLDGAKLPDVYPEAILWEVANLERRWLDSLPDSYRKWSPKWQALMEQWQTEIVEETREAPFDPVSDFGFYLFKEAVA